MGKSKNNGALLSAGGNVQCLIDRSFQFFNDHRRERIARRDNTKQMCQGETAI